jgi:hypothetical protein
MIEDERWESELGLACRGKPRSFHFMYKIGV